MKRCVLTSVSALLLVAAAAGKWSLFEKPPYNAIGDSKRQINGRATSVEHLEGGVLKTIEKELFVYAEEGGELNCTGVNNFVLSGIKQFVEKHSTNQDVVESVCNDVTREQEIIPALLNIRQTFDEAYGESAHCFMDQRGTWIAAIERDQPIEISNGFTKEKCALVVSDELSIISEEQYEVSRFLILWLSSINYELPLVIPYETENSSEMPGCEYCEKLIVIGPKVTGGLSIICSSILINHLVRSPRKLKKVTNRLLLCLALSDMLYTFIMPFLSSWMVPKDMTDADGKKVDVFGAAGNTATCAMQGTIDQFSSKTSWVYNAELAFAYFVSIRFRRGERALERFEPLLHLIPNALGLIVAVIPLHYQAYNFAGGGFCWIALSPEGCLEECERGGNARHIKLLRIWLSYIPAFVTQGIVLLSMVAMCWTVFITERKGDAYGSRTRNLTLSRKVALKCSLYVLAFEITWIFNLSRVVTDLIHDGNHETSGPEGELTYLLNILFLPTYGIWSAIAYFSLPFLAVRNAHPEWGLCQQLSNTILPSAGRTAQSASDQTSNTRIKPTAQMSYEMSPSKYSKPSLYVT
mmetsp:Transcript_1939/g.5129  ORF Transcript_1939/g.5129 Transcript_1939/m.5129 type:complete len:581 (-) Transcript_1939:7-1749(-)